MGDAAAWPEAVLKPLLTYQENMDAIVGEQKEEDEEQRERFAAQLDRLKARYLRAVATVAARSQRSGKLPEAAMSATKNCFLGSLPRRRSRIFPANRHP